jgi:thymidylate synthase
MESIKQLETSYKNIELMCEGEEYNQIEDFEIDDFIINNYVYHDSLIMEMVA